MFRASNPVAITVVLCLTEVLGMTGVASFPALQPGFQTHWGLSNTDAGWINGIFYGGYLLAVPVLVSLTDRVSSRRIYVLSTLLSAAASVVFALFAEGFWTAMAFRALAGVGMAGTYMPGLKLLSDHFGGKQSRAVAFYTASFSIGVSLSFLMSGEVAELAGWQWAFGAASLGPLLALALLSVTLPAPPAQPETTPDTHLLDFRPVLRCRPAMGYVLAYAAHNFELFAFRSWLVAFLVFVQESSSGLATDWSATVIATVVVIIGLPSSVVGNELAVRFGRQRLITVVMLGSAILAMGIGFAAYLPYWLLLVLVCVYAVTVTADSGSITAGVVAAAPQGYRGATMAVHSMIGFGGSFAGPLMFGVVLDVTGGGAVIASWGAAFVLSAVVVALGPVFLAWSRRH